MGRCILPTTQRRYFIGDGAWIGIDGELDEELREWDIAAGVAYAEWAEAHKVPVRCMGCKIDLNEDTDEGEQDVDAGEIAKLIEAMRKGQQVLGDILDDEWKRFFDLPTLQNR
jgi:hypothetical protein